MGKGKWNKNNLSHRAGNLQTGLTVLPLQFLNPTDNTNMTELGRITSNPCVKTKLVKNYPTSLKHVTAPQEVSTKLLIKSLNSSVNWRFYFFLEFYFVILGYYMQKLKRFDYFA